MEGAAAVPAEFATPSAAFSDDHSPGGLGNQVSPEPLHGCSSLTEDAPQMWRFASLYGIGRELGRKVYLDSRHEEQVAQIKEYAELFPNMLDTFLVNVTAWAVPLRSDNP
jgi:hypothetical protein